jgi:aspartyl-tRNA(Asn)/glutamyl-tRNA(Gln) amidotransferase subunit B
LRAALLFDCQIQNPFWFDRKHYSYQDLPHAYQITQYRRPYAINGAVKVKKLNGKVFPLERIQIEMDSGKVVHLEAGRDDLVDLNRAGVGLLEIVTGPIFRSPSAKSSEAAQEAVLFGKALQAALRQVGICHGNLEEGQLRFDVNVSVTGPQAPKDAGPLGTRVEIKNLNSFASLSAAIDSEADRQISLLEKGERVQPHETRSFDVAKRATGLMRGKETAKDYKFIRDFDIPEITFDAEVLEEVRRGMPKTVEQIEVEMAAKYSDLRPDQVEYLISNPSAFSLFAKTCETCKAPPKTVFTWLTVELMGYLNRQNLTLEQCAISPLNHARMLNLIEEGRLDRNSAKEVLGAMVSNPLAGPIEVATQMGLMLPVESEDLLHQVTIAITDILEKERSKAIEVRAGTRSLDYFIGPLMRQFRGQLRPTRLRHLLQQQLDQLQH